MKGSLILLGLSLWYSCDRPPVSHFLFVSIFKLSITFLRRPLLSNILRETFIFYKRKKNRRDGGHGERVKVNILFHLFVRVICCFSLFSFLLCCINPFTGNVFVSSCWMLERIQDTVFVWIFWKKTYKRRSEMQNRAKTESSPQFDCGTCLFSILFLEHWFFEEYSGLPACFCVWPVGPRMKKMILKIRPRIYLIGKIFDLNFFGGIIKFFLEQQRNESLVLFRLKCRRIYNKNNTQEKYLSVDYVFPPLSLFPSFLVMKIFHYKWHCFQF